MHTWRALALIAILAFVGCASTQQVNPPPKSLPDSPDVLRVTIPGQNRTVELRLSEADVIHDLPLLPYEKRTISHSCCACGLTHHVAAVAVPVKDEEGRVVAIRVVLFWWHDGEGTFRQRMKMGIQTTPQSWSAEVGKR